MLECSEMNILNIVRAFQSGFLVYIVDIGSREQMSEDVLAEIKDDLRRRFNKYTRKAFETLPTLEKPRILDIGCGSGVPTIELAKLTDGEIVAIDVNQSLLDRLDSKIEEEGLAGRVKTVKCSLFDIDFPDGTFDVIWAEGSIWIIGFEKGLKEWNRLLKPKGFLVIHDETRTMANRIPKIPDCGYKLIDSFPLPEDVWWTEYCKPLEIRIEDLRTKYGNDQETLRMLEECRNEIDIVKRNPQAHKSAFLVIQKSSIS